MRCDYCEYMAGVALPAHLVEVRSLARDDVWRFGVDFAGFAPVLEAAFTALAPADHPGGYWEQLAFVRRVLREHLGAETFADRLEAINAGVTA